MNQGIRRLRRRDFMKACGAAAAGSLAQAVALAAARGALAVRGVPQSANQEWASVPADCPPSGLVSA